MWEWVCKILLAILYFLIAMGILGFMRRALDRYDQQHWQRKSRDGMKMLLLTFAVLLVGCDVDRGERVTTVEVPKGTQRVWRYNIGPTTYQGGIIVREFWLADGTRCVAVGDTGVTCDWIRPTRT